MRIITSDRRTCREFSQCSVGGVRAERQRYVCHACDHRPSSKLGHSLSLAWFVGVADAGHVGAVGCLDIGEGVADQGCGRGVGL